MEAGPLFPQVEVMATYQAARRHWPPVSEILGPITIDTAGPRTSEPVSGGESAELDKTTVH